MQQSLGVQLGGWWVVATPLKMSASGRPCRRDLDGGGGAMGGTSLQVAGGNSHGTAALRWG
jgi:hypothetical protein